MDGERVTVPGEERPQAALLKLDGNHLASLVAPPWKLVVDYGGRDQLFNLRTDPHEQTNLLSSEPARARALREMLDTLVARHEGGWHIRGCAGDVKQEIRFRLFPAGGRVRTVFAEEDDTVESRPTPEHRDALYVAFRLGPREVLRFKWDRLVRVPVADEDELIIAGEKGGAPPSRLELRSVGSGKIPYRLGARGALSASNVIRLAAGAPSVRVRASQPVGCMRRQGQPNRKAALKAYLQAWYVAPAPQRTRAEVDASVAERLRALGYAW